MPELLQMELDSLVEAIEAQSKKQGSHSMKRLITDARSSVS
jgi:hypothetical protein